MTDLATSLLTRLHLQTKGQTDAIYADAHKVTAHLQDFLTPTATDNLLLLLEG